MGLISTFSTQTRQNMHGPTDLKRRCYKQICLSFHSFFPFFIYGSSEYRILSKDIKKAQRKKSYQKTENLLKQWMIFFFLTVNVKIIFKHDPEQAGWQFFFLFVCFFKSRHTHTKIYYNPQMCSCYCVHLLYISVNCFKHTATYL